jgi:hypothetical protein
MKRMHGYVPCETFTMENLLERICSMSGVAGYTGVRREGAA